MPLTTPALIVPRLVFTDNLAAPLEDAPFAWISSFRNEALIEAPESERDEFLTALLSSADLPPLELPEELRFEEIKLQPQPCLKVRAESSRLRTSAQMRAEVSFQYEQLGQKRPLSKCFVKQA